MSVKKSLGCGLVLLMVSIFSAAGCAAETDSADDEEALAEGDGDDVATAESEARKSKDQGGCNISQSLSTCYSFCNHGYGCKFARLMSCRVGSRPEFNCRCYTRRGGARCGPSR